MGQPIYVEVSRRIATSCEAVFDTWTDPVQARLWFSNAVKIMGLTGEMGRVEINPGAGGTFLICDIRDGVETCHWGTYQKWDRPNRLWFDWNTVESDETDPCIVKMSLTSDDGGCLVTIGNELEPKWASAVDGAEAGWSSMLEAIDKLLTTAKA